MVKAGELMGGVFQVDRDIFKHGIWTNVTEFRLFLFLLGNAVFSEEGVKKGDLIIQRGEFLRSLRNLREDLVYFENNAEKCYSLSTIKRTVDKLVKDGRIKKTETKLGTLFKIVNYEYYQGFTRFDKEDLKQDWNSVGTALEQHWNNNKKEKKEKKENIPSEIQFDKYNLNSNVVPVLTDFMDMRKKIKSPMTERAVSILVNQINKISTNPDDQIKILEQSIVNNWKSVYPLKNGVQDINNPDLSPIGNDFKKWK